MNDSSQNIDFYRFAKEKCISYYLTKLFIGTAMFSENDKGIKYDNLAEKPTIFELLANSASAIMEAYSFCIMRMPRRKYQSFAVYPAPTIFSNSGEKAPEGTCQSRIVDSCVTRSYSGLARKGFSLL